MGLSEGVLKLSVSLEDKSGAPVAISFAAAAAMTAAGTAAASGGSRGTWTDFGDVLEIVLGLRFGGGRFLIRSESLAWRKLWRTNSSLSFPLALKMQHQFLISSACVQFHL